MSYASNLGQFCPIDVQQIVRAADLSQASSARVFDQVLAVGAVDWPCYLTTISYIGQSLTNHSNLQTQNAWLTQVATYAGLFSGQQLEDIRATLIRLAVPGDNGLLYFAALRKNDIDIRAQLTGRVPESWDFADPRDMSAMSWHYNLYLAYFWDGDALKRLSDKIADTKNSNDVAILLNSLAQLASAPARDIVKLYVNDPRIVQGSEGPGPTVSEVAQNLIKSTAWK